MSPLVQRALCTPYRRKQALTSRNESQRLKGEYGDRITTVERDPFTWEAYSEVEQQGLLDDVPTVGFERGEARGSCSCQVRVNLLTRIPRRHSPPELLLLGSTAKYRLRPAAVRATRLRHCGPHVVLPARTDADGFPRTESAMECERKRSSLKLETSPADDPSPLFLAETVCQARRRSLPQAVGPPPPARRNRADRDPVATLAGGPPLSPAAKRPGPDERGQGDAAGEIARQELRCARVCHAAHVCQQGDTVAQGSRVSTKFTLP